MMKQEKILVAVSVEHLFGESNVITLLDTVTKCKE